MSPCTVYMISCAIEQYYLWPNGKNVFFYSSFWSWVCLFVLLLSCRFLSLPECSTSQFSCLEQLTPMGQNLHVYQEKSVSQQRVKIQQSHQYAQSCYHQVLLHYYDIKDAHEPDAPFTPKTSSSITCPKPNIPRHQSPSVSPCHFAGALKPM